MRTRAQGKLPLAIKALAMGIPPHELIINPAQVGRMPGMFDAVVPSGGLDIHGGKSSRNAATFQITNLPSKATFQSLILVMRSRDPADWTDLRELEEVFWLGCVPHADYKRAVAGLMERASEPIDGLNGRLKANVTIGSRRVSWLGDYIRWVRFSDLDRAWWHDNVVCPGVAALDVDVLPELEAPSSDTTGGCHHGIARGHRDDDNSPPVASTDAAMSTANHSPAMGSKSQQKENAQPVHQAAASLNLNNHAGGGEGSTVSRAACPGRARAGADARGGAAEATPGPGDQAPDAEGQASCSGINATLNMSHSGLVRVDT